MNTTHACTRRSLVRHAALGGVALLGATFLPKARFAGAQDLARYVCEYNDVNLRDDYGLESNIIGQVNYGDVVYFSAGPIEADGYTWRGIVVEATGASGWAVQDYFSRAGNEYGWQPGAVVHVTSDDVNMRAGAGLDQTVIAAFNTGATGTITAGPFPNDGYDWYELSINGTAGYMAADFLAEGSGEGGGGIPAGTIMHVATDELNLRSAPGVGASVVKSLEFGTTVTIAAGPEYADDYAWYEVTLSGGGSGWVAGEYLADGPGSSEPTGNRLQVVDGPLNLRSGPSLENEAIRSLAYGTIVVVADASFVNADGYTWINVYLEDDPSTAGWIAQGFTDEI